MTKCIYGIYDKKMSEFTQVVLLDENEFEAYFIHVSNDVTSPYFRKEDDFEIYRMFNMDNDTNSFEFVNYLSEFISNSTRDLQVITQTLNFLPIGYFKMPKEMQEQVQQQIKDCVYDYVNNHLADEQKMAINSALSDCEVNNG